MKDTYLCPACLTELADDYPFDHIAIDRVLTTQSDLFAVMTRPERTETVLTGLQRGMSVTGIATRLQISTGYVRALLPVDHPEAPARRRETLAAEQNALDAKVSQLWQQGLPDTVISLRTGRSVYKIAGIRRRLGLATVEQTRRMSLPGGVR